MGQTRSGNTSGKEGGNDGCRRCRLLYNDRSRGENALFFNASPGDGGFPQKGYIVIVCALHVPTILCMDDDGWYPYAVAAVRCDRYQIRRRVATRRDVTPLTAGPSSAKHHVHVCGLRLSKRARRPAHGECHRRYDFDLEHGSRPHACLCSTTSSGWPCPRRRNATRPRVFIFAPSPLSRRLLFLFISRFRPFLLRTERRCFFVQHTGYRNQWRKLTLI